MFKKYFRLILTLCIIAIYVIIQGFPLLLEGKGEMPVITFDESKLTVSVKDSDKKLLEGVHASDEEDGDLTNLIRIESKSPFISKNQRSITYVVLDEDDNVTKTSRIIEYNDYTAPTFSLNDQLRSPGYSTTLLTQRVKAKSSVDGDISSKVTIMNMDYAENETLKIRLSVTDSTNTTSYLNVNYHMEEEKELDIKLKKYLVYLNKDQEFDYQKNIKTVIDGIDKVNSLRSHVKIDVPKMDKPGIYEVTYALTRSNGDSGITTMVVVVE